MLLKQLKSIIYNKLILFTADSYTSVFTSLEPHTKVLDVGVGTAHALIQNFALLQKKDIQVHGIDIDDAYLAQASVAIKKAGTTQLITVEYGDITEKSYNHSFDTVYFSDSFMIISKEKRKQALLNALKSLKNGNGKIYFTQTHEKKRSFF